MSATVINCKSITSALKKQLKQQVIGLKQNYGKVPGFLSVKIGEDHASDIYMKSQERLAAELGIKFQARRFKDTASQSKIKKFLVEQNNSDKITSIMIQHPVPAHLNFDDLLYCISPEKDAEGIHPENLGKIFLEDTKVGPCTPMAVMEIIKNIPIQMYGKETVIVGHSDVVGKPLSILLLKDFATTTVCHVATYKRDLLKKHLKRAEVLIVAVGKPNLIKGDWIRKNAIVIDVGINRVGSKIVGDVDFEEAEKTAAFITPVPGGVGQLTVIMLMRNVIEQFKLQVSGI